MPAAADFNQCHVSKGLEFFKQGALENWECAEYHDPNSPAIFFGVYHAEDIECFEKHRSYKILILGGSDFQNVSRIKNFSNTFSPAYIEAITNRLQSRGVYCKPWPTAVSHFDYIPRETPLGDKIYVYSGNHQRDYLNDDSGLNKGLFRECIQPLIERLGKERFIFAQRLPMKELIDTVYKKCFIFIKPNELGGVTSMWELGLMGRKTITCGTMDAPNIIDARLRRKVSKIRNFFRWKKFDYPSVDVVGYQDIESVANAVNAEAKKIGEINSALATEVRTMLNARPWQNLDFWLDNQPRMQ